MIHSDEFKDKVGHCSEVKELCEIPGQHVFHSEAYWHETTYYNGTHTNFTFPPSPHRGHEQNENCYGNCGNSQTEFRILLIDHDDNELNRESKEKEEVEFQKSNVNLIYDEYL